VTAPRRELPPRPGPPSPNRHQTRHHRKAAVTRPVSASPGQPPLGWPGTKPGGASRSGCGSCRSARGDGKLLAAASGQARTHPGSAVTYTRAEAPERAINARNRVGTRGLGPGPNRGTFRFDPYEDRSPGSHHHLPRRSPPPEQRFQSRRDTPRTRYATTHPSPPVRTLEPTNPRTMSQPWTRRWTSTTRPSARSSSTARPTTMTS